MRQERSDRVELNELNVVDGGTKGSTLNERVHHVSGKIENNSSNGSFTRDIKYLLISHPRPLLIYICFFQTNQYDQCEKINQW